MHMTNDTHNERVPALLWGFSFFPFHLAASVAAAFLLSAVLTYEGLQHSMKPTIKHRGCNLLVHRIELVQPRNAQKKNQIF